MFFEMQQNFQIRAIFFILFIGFISSCRTNRPNHTTRSNNKSDLSFYEHKLGIHLPNTVNIEFIKAISEWIGTPYKYGGSSISGTDCSGFVSSIYLKVFKIQLERTSLAMSQKARKIEKNNLLEGDLLFFTIEGNKVSHVGMHITEDYFIHASTKKGVVINGLKEPYYNSHFISYGTYR